jgi:hypothetical protein
VPAAAIRIRVDRHDEQTRQRHDIYVCAGGAARLRRLMDRDFFVRLLISALFIVAAALAYTGALDSKGEKYADEAFQRSLIAFGVARALNGVISVAQGTEIAVQPAGIGVSLAPGQILQPVNDLVERFSWVMLASSASLGIQKMLLSISRWPYFSLFVIVLFSLAALLVWVPAFTRSIFGRYFLKFVMTFVFIRFAVSLIAISSELIYLEFLEPQYEEAKTRLVTATENFSHINKVNQQESDTNENASILERAKHWYESAARSIDIEARIEQYQQAAATASEYAIQLIVIFVVQTILFPIIFLVIIYFLAKNIFKIRYRIFSGESP